MLNSVTVPSIVPASAPDLIRTRSPTRNGWANCSIAPTNRSSTARAQRAKANVEISAKTKNAAVPLIVIRWPTSTLTRLAAAAVAAPSGTPATCTAAAAASASTSATIACQGRLCAFSVAVSTAQRYRQARWSRRPAGPARRCQGRRTFSESRSEVHERAADRKHRLAPHAVDHAGCRGVPGHQGREESDVAAELLESRTVREVRDEKDDLG